MAKILLHIDFVRPHSNGKLIAREFKKQGQIIQTFDRRHSLSEYVKIFKSFKPDMIFDASNYQCLDHCEYAHNHKASVVTWNPDVYFIYDPEYKPKTLRMFDVCDMYITTMKGYVKDSLPYTNKVVHFPYFFSNNYYIPTVKRSFKHDIVFVGTNHKVSPHRVEYIEALKDAGLDVFVRGAPYGNASYLGDVVANTYVQSKMGLNIATKGIFDKELQFSVRVFHILGCGTMLLSERIKGMNRVFEEGKHLIMFDTKEEMIEKAMYYSKHDDEREQIALEGKKEIFSKHLISIRVKQFLDEFKKRGYI